jgi:ribonuclease J
MGRHHAVLDLGDRSVVLDAGSIFPEAWEVGLDRRLPPRRPWRERWAQGRLAGVILTHGHLDHVGALGCLLEEAPQLPVWGTAWTLAVVRRVFAGHPRWEALRPDLRVVHPGQWYDIAGVPVSWAAVTHSIPGACSVAVRVPGGLFVHSGDFRIDEEPLVGDRCDQAWLRAWGDEGVVAAAVDSTNAGRSGRTRGEADVARSLRSRIAQADGRVVVTLFGSHLERLVGLARAAQAAGRCFQVMGRSLEGTLALGCEMGLWPSDVPVPAAVGRDGVKSDAVLAVTGSQGEERSPLARAARGEEARWRPGPGDLVLWSARAIPGSERAVGRVVNRLVDLGAAVEPPWAGETEIHGSGHGHGEEVLEWLSWVRPRAILPIHGEAWHLKRHAEMAGLRSPRSVVLELRNGDRLVGGRDGVRRCEGEGGVDEVLLGTQRWEGDDRALRERRDLREGGASFVVLLPGWPPQVRVRTLGVFPAAETEEKDAAVARHVRLELQDRGPPVGTERVASIVKSRIRELSGLRVAIRVLDLGVVENA